MPPKRKQAASALEIDRLAVQLAKDPQSKVFLPLAEEYCKSGMWQEAAAVLEDGLKYYPGFITAMVVLGRAYDQLGQVTKAKAVLEEAVKLSPDNLRAHRILIKIYAAQGMTSQALKSCDVILSLNPCDEEARTVQAKLKRATSDVTGVKEGPSAKASSDAAAGTSSASPVEPDSEVTNQRSDPPEDNPATGPTMVERSPRAKEGPADSSLSASASNAETIEQLESWLRSIEQERRDRRRSEERRVGKGGRS